MSKPHFEQMRASVSSARLMSNDTRASSASTGFELFFGFDLDDADFELDFGASSSSGTEIRVWHCGHFTAFPRAASGTERTFSQLVHFTLTGIGQQPSKSIVNAGRSRPSLSLIRQIQGKRPFVAACQMPRPRREGVDNGFRNQRDKMTTGRTPSVPSQTRPARRFRKQSGGHDFQQVTPRRTEFKSLRLLSVKRKCIFGCVKVLLVNYEGVWPVSILTRTSRTRMSSTHFTTAGNGGVAK